jgi:HSP20 family protein
MTELMSKTNELMSKWLDFSIGIKFNINHDVDKIDLTKKYQTMKLVKYNQLDPAYPATFSTLLDRFFNDSIGQNLKQFTPAVDISEDESKYELHVSVPGMKKTDFNLDLTEGRLTVSGERKMEEKKEGKNYHSLETHYGSFSRSFYLPDDVNSDSIEAVYEDGLLKINLPKAEKKVNKAKIEVK